MPKRFNFLVYVENGGYGYFRERFIENVPFFLNSSDIKPTDFMLLDCDDQSKACHKWGERNDIIHQKISDSELLFIYFSEFPHETDKRQVLSISDGKLGSVYDISIDEIRFKIIKDLIANKIEYLFNYVKMYNFRCLVASGYELEIQDDYNSTDEIIDELLSPYSLAEWLCVSRHDILEYPHFVKYAELGDVLILRRIRRSSLTS